jgi:hypothetical protein
MATNPQPAPTPVDDEPLPRHSASETPVRRLDRIAFQVWVVCVLLTLTFALLFYLIDKFFFAK